jgi:hypothetical protein
MAEKTPLEEMVRKAFDMNLRYWETVGRATTDYVEAAAKLWADAPISWPPGVRDKGSSRGGSASSEASASTAASGQSASSSRAGAWESTEAAATPVLLLEGRAGTEARAMVMISNDLDREAEAAVVASPLRGPDGRFVAADLRTEPTAVKLAPGARTSVTLVVGVTDAMEVGADYRGEINVPGLSPRGVPVVVRRLP